MTDFKTIAVIVAAGKGLRMKSKQKKQFLELEGLPVLIHTLNTFDRMASVHEMVLVVPEPDMAFCGEMVETHGISVHITSGGKDRQGSVAKGLAKARDLVTEPENAIVLVHDGVRPFVTPETVEACIRSAWEKGACIPALPVSDTIKRVNEINQIEKTLDRSRLFRAQTPQAFRMELGLSAFEYALDTGFKGTDEASILEHADIKVSIVPGSDVNIKLTTPDDLSLARFILSSKP